MKVKSKVGVSESYNGAGLVKAEANCTKCLWMNCLAIICSVKCSL